MADEHKLDENKRTINGAFSFRGERSYEVAEAFYNWCEQIEKDFDLVIISNRADYNGYWPMNRTINVEKQKKEEKK